MFRKKKISQYEELYGVPESNPSGVSVDVADEPMEESVPAQKATVKKEKKPRKKIDWEVTLKDKRILGAALIAVALLMGVIVSPTMQHIEKTADVTAVIAVSDIPKDTLITTEMVKTVSVTKNALLSGMRLSAEHVIGKYTTVEITAQEPFLSSHLTSQIPYKDSYLHTLPDNKKAMSVTVTTLASSLSGKVQPDDIVTVYAYIASDDEETKYIARQPQELMYVRVLDVSDQYGATVLDSELSTASKEEQPSTVTLLVNDAQARVLAGLDKSAPVHLAVCCRGNAEKAQSLLDEQEILLQVESEEPATAAPIENGTIPEQEENQNA